MHSPLESNLTWFIPSFYGDLRLEVVSPKACRLILENLTVQERRVLATLEPHARKKGWIDPKQKLEPGTVTMAAPIEKVAKEIAKALRPGRKMVSVVRFASGQMEEIHSAKWDATTADLAPASDTPSDGHPHRTAELRTDEEPKKETPAKVEEPEPPKKAATVTAPTRGCPAPDFSPAELKARRVLEAFLDPEQLDDFRRHNRFITRGAVTGHRYMITSRHNRAGLKTFQERQLFDIEENRPLCVHDYDVPPAEEMLSIHVLLQLPGYELWLRDLPE